MDNMVIFTNWKLRGQSKIEETQLAAKVFPIAATVAVLNALTIDACSSSQITVVLTATITRYITTNFFHVALFDSKQLPGSDSGTFEKSS
jgi:hypothetical protein